MQYLREFSMVFSQQANQRARKPNYGSRYPTDESLLASIASGESSAFNKLFDRYYRPVSNFIRRRFETDEMVEDITQEVFLRVFKSARTFKGDKKFSSWVFKIASNEVKRHWKSRCNRQTLSLSHPAAQGDSCDEPDYTVEDLRAEPAAVIEQELIARDLRAQIERLPGKQRAVVLLKYYGELTFAEISMICNSPLSTVLSRMRYAVNKLKLSSGPVSYTHLTLPTNREV